MLVTFYSDAHEDVIYFGDVAQQLLKAMGQSGVVPSAILAKDVPQALALLTEAMGIERSKPVDGSSKDAQEVRLVYRAMPLIALLQHAADTPCDVLWR